MVCPSVVPPCLSYTHTHGHTHTCCWVLALADAVRGDEQGAHAGGEQVVALFVVRCREEGREEVEKKKRQRVGRVDKERAGGVRSHAMRAADARAQVRLSRDGLSSPTAHPRGAATKPLAHSSRAGGRGARRQMAARAAARALCKVRRLADPRRQWPGPWLERVLAIERDLVGLTAGPLDPPHARGMPLAGHRHGNRRGSGPWRTRVGPGPRHTQARARPPWASEDSKHHRCCPPPRLFPLLPRFFFFATRPGQGPPFPKPTQHGSTRLHTSPAARARQKSVPP